MEVRKVATYTFISKTFCLKMIGSMMLVSEILKLLDVLSPMRNLLRPKKIEPFHILDTYLFDEAPTIVTFT